MAILALRRPRQDDGQPGTSSKKNQKPENPLRTKTIKVDIIKREVIGDRKSNSGFLLEIGMVMT